MYSLKTELLIPTNPSLINTINTFQIEFQSPNPISRQPNTAKTPPKPRKSISVPPQRPLSTRGINRGKGSAGAKGEDGDEGYRRGYDV